MFSSPLSAVLVALSIPCAPVFTWPPPPGGGDLHVPDETKPTGQPTASWLSDVIGTISASSPQLAAEINNSISDGGIVIGFMKSPSTETEDGVTDGNTILLSDSVSTDIDGAAALLVHEWQHVRQYNGQPGDPCPDNANCRDAYAYLAQMIFMCTLSDSMHQMYPDDLLNKHAPFSCEGFVFVKDRIESYSASCLSQTGHVLGSSGCVCTYCR